MEGWMDRWKGGWMERQTDGWIEGWMNGWKKKKFINAVYLFMVVVYMFIHVISNNCTCVHVFIIYSQIVNPGDLFDSQVANFTQYQHFIFL